MRLSFINISEVLRETQVCWDCCYLGKIYTCPQQLSISFSCFRFGFKTDGPSAENRKINYIKVRLHSLHSFHNFLLFFASRVDFTRYRVEGYNIQNVNP